MSSCPSSPRSCLPPPSRVPSRSAATALACDSSEDKTTSSPQNATGAGKKRRKKLYKTNARRKKRALERAAQDAFCYAPDLRVADKYVDVTSIRGNVSAKSFDRCEGSWIAKKMPDLGASANNLKSLNELLAAGMRLIKWNGRFVWIFSPPYRLLTVI